MFPRSSRDPRPTRSRRACSPGPLLAAAVLTLLGLSDRAGAQAVEGAAPAPVPALAAPVERMLEAPYLTPEEAKDRRIFHGAWEGSDLDSPERAARAALIRGDFNDPSFNTPDVGALLKAEAALGRGDPAAALTLLDDAGEAAATTLGARLRAGALETLGRFDEAAKAAEAALLAFDRAPAHTPEDVVEAVRLASQLLRLRGPGDAGVGPAQDYHSMIRVLGQIRSNADRLYWPAVLAEAELLYERDNSAQAQEAIEQLLSLNPSSAAGWALYGRMSVDAFNFDATASIAARLDELAGRLGSEDDRPGLSIDAAALRARAALRQVDGEGAVAALEPALKAYPTHPELLALRAAAEAVRFEFDALKTRLAEFDALYPGCPVAVHAVGRALSEARQYAEAAAFLNEAIERLPTAADPWIDLGLLEVQSGRDTEALRALEKAFALDPFNVRADNSLRLIRELVNYERVESEHFVVRHKPGEDGVLAREMLEPLEELHRVVSGDQPGGIDHEPAVKTVIELMPDHEWFAVRIAGMPRIHTIAASTGPVIAMEAPRTGANHQGTYDWVRVVRHEYVHTVTLSRTKNRIPHWFTEAAAVYLELSPRDYSTCQLLASALEADELFDFVQINRAFVRLEKPTDRSQAYAQGHWMYEYIVERWGARAPLDLMDLYAQGVREEQAFAAVLGTPRERFFADFKEWARDQVRAWGLLPSAGTPTLKELLAAEKPKGTPEEPDNEDSADLVPTPEMVQRWLEQHPAHPDVLELAVDAALAASGGKATPENAPLLERYAAARPVDPKPHRLLAKMHLDAAAAQAPIADAQTDARRAIEHLEYLDAREQRTPAYALELAKRHFALGDLVKAQAKAERATRIAPYEAPPRELAAAVAIQAKDFAAAERHIRALTILEPKREIHKQRLEALQRMAESAR